MLQAVFPVRLQAESLSGLLLKPSIPHGGSQGKIAVVILFYIFVLCVYVYVCVYVSIYSLYFQCLEWQ